MSMTGPSGSCKRVLDAMASSALRDITVLLCGLWLLSAPVVSFGGSCPSPAILLSASLVRLCFLPLCDSSLFSCPASSFRVRADRRLRILGARVVIGLSVPSSRLGPRWYRGRLMYASLTLAGSCYRTEHCRLQASCSPLQLVHFLDIDGSPLNGHSRFSCSCAQ